MTQKLQRLKKKSGHHARLKAFFPPRFTVQMGDLPLVTYQVFTGTEITLTVRQYIHREDIRYMSTSFFYFVTPADRSDKSKIWRKRAFHLSRQRHSDVDMDGATVEVPDAMWYQISQLLTGRQRKKASIEKTDDWLSSLFSSIPNKAQGVWVK